MRGSVSGVLLLLYYYMYAQCCVCNAVHAKGENVIIKE